MHFLVYLRPVFALFLTHVEAGHIKMWVCVCGGEGWRPQVQTASLIVSYISSYGQMTVVSLAAHTGQWVQLTWNVLEYIFSSSTGDVKRLNCQCHMRQRRNIDSFLNIH